MRQIIFAVALSAAILPGCSEVAAEPSREENAETTLERNKRLAAEFYENLWFTNNTGVYADFVAEKYVVHDIGNRKNITEPAIAQKEVADLFHSFGDLSGEIDYQIAEGDKVATRWFVSLDPSEQGKAMGMTKVDRVPIINVFRFDESGKIVEIWNHRHDIDLPQPPGGEKPADGN